MGPSAHLSGRVLRAGIGGAASAAPLARFAGGGALSCRRHRGGRFRAAAAGFLALGLSMGAAGGAAAQAEPPRRVVSINLCTDQLALILGAPGQLRSVTALAQDPRMSVMARQAQALPANHGRAEEVFLHAPDLVLAGSYTNHATVDMLERLGVPVLRMAPATTLAQVRERLLEAGRALGREDRAAEVVAAYDRRLAALSPPAGPRPTAANYAANGYAAGRDSLSAELLEAAGFDHLADDLGLSFGGFLPLELLVMADPDLLVLARANPGAARAEDILRHPALHHLGGQQVALEDRDWICGLPAVLDGAERLAALRREMEKKPALRREMEKKPALRPHTDKEPALRRNRDEEAAR
ncbi:ABC transporter substrate-binding protein [Phaeovulum vinaykumarii]|nr:ABC transporter substrate-binding protein [Phaeovulum vinaykumarii]